MRHWQKVQRRMGNRYSRSFTTLLCVISFVNIIVFINAAPISSSDGSNTLEPSGEVKTDTTQENSESSKEYLRRQVGSKSDQELKLS